MNENFVSCEVQPLFQNDAISVLQSIVGCMYCGIVIAKTGSTGFVVWNERAKEIMGKPQADILPDEWASYYGVYGIDAQELMPTQCLPLVVALAGGKITNQELFIRNEYQPGAFINCTATPIQKGDEVIGGVVVFQDITKEKRLEQQATDLLEKLRLSHEKMLEMKKAAGEWANPPAALKISPE